MSGDYRSPIRIGVLGAAKITPMALLQQAKKIGTVSVVAVAARDLNRAQRFAERHAIPQVFEDYDALINSDNIDAVYNPLPNSHHAHWSILALKAGKHVLCEKPIAANAQEARMLHQVALEEGLVLMEAFHWRYHPLANRTLELLEQHTLGTIEHVEASFCIPQPFTSDIRYNPALAGGALMDTGCYTINMLRHCINEEPQVVHARAALASPQIDRYMEAKLHFPSGVEGQIRCSLWGWPLLSVFLRVSGTEGCIEIVNPVIPHILYHHLKIRSPGLNTTERFWGKSTYLCQLEAFVEAIVRNHPIPTSSSDGIQNMELIDEIYRSAGLLPRRGMLA